MDWCFGGLALLMCLFSILALTMHPLRLLRHMKPLATVRGCLALMCLMLALGFVALAWLIAR